MQKTQQGNLRLIGEFDSETGTDRRGAFAQQSRGKVCLLLLLFHMNGVSENHFRNVMKVDHMVGKTFSPKGVDEKIKFQGIIFPEVRSTEGKYCPEGRYNSLCTTGT